MAVKLNFGPRKTKPLKVFVSAEYIVSGLLEVELPEGKTWNDVEEFWVKWDTVYIEFKDGTKFEDEVGTDQSEADMKWPITCKVYASQETEYGTDCDWDTVLQEQD